MTGNWPRCTGSTAIMAEMTTRTITLATREVVCRDRKGREISGGIHAIEPKSLVESLHAIKECTPDQTTKNNIQTLIDLILNSAATF